jgi:hypothetical protein
MKDRNIKKLAYEENLARAIKGDDDVEMGNENKVIDLNAINKHDSESMKIDDVSTKAVKKVKKVKKENNDAMDVDTNNTTNTKPKTKKFVKKKKGKSHYIMNFV